MIENMQARFAVRRRFLRCVKGLRRLIRREDGTAAIEFGLVAVPFLALVFAIIETAMIFFAGQILETAVADSARLILTGQAQTTGLNQTTFKDAVCSKVHGVINCASGVYVDVRSFTTFSNVTLTNPVDANGNLIQNFTYQPGGPGDIVVVRLMYQWPVFVSLLGLNGLSNMSGNSRLLISTAAFRNEPYQ